MKRLVSLVIFASVFFLQGCATYYSVRINGFSDARESGGLIPPGASFYIMENKNSKNPIFEKEISLKIGKLLVQKGYRLESYDNADMILSFVYSISSGRNVSDIRPVYQPQETGTIRTIKPNGSVSTSFVTFPGYTQYYPYKVTVYTSSLILEVSDAASVKEAREEKKLWIGEIASTSENADLRDTINYLLVACFQYFGENTSKSVSLNISGSDARIKDLSH